MPNRCCKGFYSYFASANAVNQYAPHVVIEPKHLDIQLKIGDLKDKRLEATVTITFEHGGQALIKNKKDLSSAVLNAEGFLYLRIEGASHSYDGHQIQLSWPEPFEKNVQRKVTVKYVIDHPVAGLYFQNEDSLITDKDCCWAITDHETEKARHWLPTIDFPTIRTTLTWSISAPAQYTSLANGSLLSEHTENGITTTRWELKYPCPSYLICFAVGEFTCVDAGQVDGRPIKYYSARSYAPADIKRTFDETPDMMRWLQAKLGVPFPWPKYYQIALPAIRGAMENISLVTWSDICIMDEKLVKERKYVIDTINVHEMAHTYFGDLLVIRHFEHVWLKESWAQYMESCWLQDNLSEDDFRYEMVMNAQSYIKECNKDYMRPLVTRVYDSSWDLYDSHTYPGGAWRVHMLRSILGDDAFWAGVKSYIETFSAKTVQTSDFQTSLERASGLNLTRFFDEWVYSKGYPQLKGSYNYDLSQGTVQITISQSQINSEIPLFAFDLDIELVDNKGRKYNKTLTFDREASATASFALPDKDSQPMILRVDPNFTVLHTLDMTPDQRILENTATRAEDVPNRTWAYAELIKSGAYSALKYVEEHIFDEPFYGVRSQVAALLAKQKSALALKILAAMVKREKNPIALVHVVAACQIQEDCLRNAILDLLSRAVELPYRAHAAALVSLAAQRNNADIEYLLQVAKDDKKIGQHAIIRGGALKALGYHRSIDCFKYLLDHVGYNIEPVRARAQAIHGLKYSAEHQDERFQKLAVEALAKIVRDPNLNVRMAAVEALVGLKAKDLYHDVEDSRYLYSKDEQSWLDRKLYELYQSGSTPDKSTQDRIEKLEERVRKLEEKLQQLASHA
ncbi:peptidase family M1-domain-containing protein [Fennellomyces sp. T-0311]|nr:peptidase family M1-domain-containing protein [Fennellomyces sp. T-0311]